MSTEREQLTERLFELMATPSFIPMRKRRLAKKLAIDMETYPTFRQLIDELVDRGEIAELKKGKYGLALSAPNKAVEGGPPGKNPDKSKGLSLKGLPPHALVGRIEIKRGGFGFVISETPGKDLFVAGENLGGALSGDKVAVVCDRPHGGRTKGRGRGHRGAGPQATQARVIRILERGRTLIVGTYYARHTGRDREAWVDAPQGPTGYVVPDTRGMFGELEVLPEDQAGAKPGDKVAVELVEPDERYRAGRKPTVRVVRIFGKAGETQSEYEAIIKNFELRTEFPQEALWQADLLEPGVPEEELRQRVDYTSLMTFAIDPATAKDHDDAVSIRTLPDGRTELLVHIADVAYHVPAGSPIDKEARERGTSVYLPGHHIPMLPEPLSAGVCSLKEGRLRLTKTVRIVFSKRMKREIAYIERSYIRSSAFLNYDQVYQALEEDRPDLLPSQQIFDTLQEMKALAARLRQKRMDGGALQLDLPEIRVELDEEKRFLGCEKVVSNWSHGLIEEFMLAANRVVAEYTLEHEIPALYRVHEEPEPDALEKFAQFLRELGVKMKKPYDREALSSVLERVRDKPYQDAVHLALLTSLKQALYMAECHPHFALAWGHYLHFTSPIRRYPDLIVHRMLDTRFDPGQSTLPLKGKRRKGGAQSAAYFEQIAEMRGLAFHCSRQERNADAAERDVARFYQLQHLKQHQKASHPGVIKGVRSFGLFVELQDCYVEGQVRIQDLADDYYDYYPEAHLLEGRRKHRCFRLGDKVTVRVVHVDPGQKTVGLMIV